MDKDGTINVDDFTNDTIHSFPYFYQDYDTNHLNALVIRNVLL